MATVNGIHALGWLKRKFYFQRPTLYPPGHFFPWPGYFSNCFLAPLHQPVASVVEFQSSQCRQNLADKGCWCKGKLYKLEQTKWNVQRPFDKGPHNGPRLGLPTGQWSQNKNQNQNKNGLLRTKPSMVIPVPWPESYRKWICRTEEKHQREVGNLMIL